MNRTHIVAVCGLLVASSVGAIEPQAKTAAPSRPPSVRSLAYSPDGKLLVAGVGRKGEPGAVIAWDTATRKPLWKKTATTGFWSVTFSPDGKSLAVVDGHASALRFDATTGGELGEVGPHPAVVRAAVHIPGTDLLATGSDGTIRLWDLKTGKVAKELKGGHPAEVGALVVSPNGKWLISSGPDTTRLWDVVAGTELKDILRQSQGIGYYGIAFVGPDRVMMSNNSAISCIMELPSGKKILQYKGWGGVTAYTPKLGRAATSWHGSDVNIRDLNFHPPTVEEKARIEKLLKDFDSDSYEVRIAASKAMKEVGSVAEPLLRAAMTDGPSAEVKMRARETRLTILEEPFFTLNGHTSEVGTMAFAPDGKTLATGAADGTIRLWDPLTGKELARFDVATDTPSR